MKIRTGSHFSLTFSSGANMKKVVLFSPAFNVAQFLPLSLPLWEALAAVLAHMNIAFGCYILDDCSTDETPRILDAFALEHPWFKVVHNDQNLKNAGNILKGYHMAVASGADIVGCMDADREHDPMAVVGHLITHLLPRKYDGVVGTIAFPESMPGAIDRMMMKWTGAAQAAAMGAEAPYLIQSGGYQLHWVSHVKKALARMPVYQQRFSEFFPMADFPSWGMHGVLNHLMSWDEQSTDVKNPLPPAIRLYSAYLQCLGPSPNRTPQKLLQQSDAAQKHLMVLGQFYPIRQSTFTFTG